MAWIGEIIRLVKQTFYELVGTIKLNFQTKKILCQYMEWFSKLKKQTLQTS